MQELDCRLKDRRSQKIDNLGRGVVKWSKCSPSTQAIRVRNPADAYSFSVNFVFEKIKNKHKRGRGWPI